jgi:hypothetical protein
MSTHCIIYHGEEYIGVDWDGYPEWIVPSVQNFVTLFGLPRLYELIHIHNEEIVNSISVCFRSLKNRDLGFEWDSYEPEGEYSYNIENNYILWTQYEEDDDGEEFEKEKKEKLKTLATKNDLYRRMIYNCFEEEHSPNEPADQVRLL